MKNNDSSVLHATPKIIAIVGMAGSGKSEVVTYLHTKNIPFVRFGQITDEGLAKEHLPLTPDNEKAFREKIRKEHGMAAYAILSKPKIIELLATNTVVVIDGLYSFEEYLYLKQLFQNLLLIHVFAEPPVRYARLDKRPIRPVPFAKSRDRDITEIEILNKGGPIALADYQIVNNTDEIDMLYKEIDKILERIANTE